MPHAAPPNDSLPLDRFSVLCIDDNVLLVDALERRLALEPGFDQLIRVEDLADAVTLVAAHRPAIVLLDVDLPGGIDALVLLERIVALESDSRVVVLTGYPQGALISRYMSRGAWGFISKGVTSDRLIGALHRVRGGEAVIELDD
ncbi:MAG: response regulator transcription factor [Gemmatimonadaceae bacterium]|nr:response regulator transcription factor [Gemmatimonadaceae bacterium]